MTMTFFEQMGSRARIHQVLNVLLEAPFFYPADDPDLFAYLRRHREEIRRFFHEAFGWQLVVDPAVARLYKPRWHNAALKRSQHDVFALTRKDECIAFLIVLDFYEHLLEERGGSEDDAEPLRFEMGDLFAHARERLPRSSREGGDAPEGEARVDDDDVRRMFRELVPQLLRARFLREVPPDRDARDTPAPERCLYECLPGLRAYDVRALGDAALIDAFGGEAAFGARDEVRRIEGDPS